MFQHLQGTPSSSYLFLQERAFLFYLHNPEKAFHTSLVFQSLCKIHFSKDSDQLLAELQRKDQAS